MSFVGVSVGIGAAGVGLSAYRMIKEEKKAKQAAKAISDYQRQELVNTGEGLQVSTAGADLRKEQQARLNESYLQSLREGGTRALLGGIGRVQTNNQDLSKEIGVNLDEQQKQIDMYKAQEEQNIRNMKENREQQDLAGLSSQYNASKEASAQALGSGLQSLSMLGQGLSNIKPKETDGVESVVSEGFKPAGLVTTKNPSILGGIFNPKN